MPTRHKRSELRCLLIGICNIVRVARISGDFLLAHIMQVGEIGAAHVLLSSLCSIKLLTTSSAN